MKRMKIQLAVKRGFDIVVSIFLLLVFLPVWILVCVLIIADSRGPVFFLQERPGLHRKIFRVYKFRTMKPGSDKMVKGQEVMKNDDRITPTKEI